MLHEYHVIYSVRYYPRFHITAVGLATYYPWILGHYCISFLGIGLCQTHLAAPRLAGWSY
jgi:hypothetical protein